ncbi:hypothetical protein MTCOM_11360 [Moorella thermoacetica]|nr:hypothetical protein MOOTH_02310 [Moorella thermoacetica]
MAIEYALGALYIDVLDSTTYMKLTSTLQLMTGS